MKNTDIEKELKRIFDKNYSNNSDLEKIVKRGFVYSELDLQKKVLFVGINPSYIEGSSNAYDHISYKPNDAVTGYPKHYKRFHDLAIGCGVDSDWTYMDLLFLREKDQKMALSLVNQEMGLEFICDQLKLSMKLLEESKPKLIVVCNGGAGHFFGMDKTNENDTYSNVWMGYDFKFDEHFGVEVITGISQESIGVKETNLKGIPVLFTSTLTYMHGSTRKRLEWQIKKILNFYDIFFGKEYNSENRLEILLKQLENLTEHLEKTRQSKNTEVKEQHYHKASKLRDKEVEETKRIVGYILSVLSLS